MKRSVYNKRKGATVRRYVYRQTTPLALEALRDFDL